MDEQLESESEVLSSLIFSWKQQWTWKTELEVSYTRMQIPMYRLGCPNNVGTLLTLLFGKILYKIEEFVEKSTKCCIV